MLIPNIFPVTCNTKHVGPGSTFVAIKGFKEDGTMYISLAIEKGATTILVDAGYQPTNIPEHVNIISVEDTRQALATYAAQALGNPAQKLKLIGITGTAGKTTTTYLVEHILENAGFKTALLGSIKNKIGTQEEASSLTTPEADYIYMFLAECVKQRIDYVVMEVSSHSIALSRIHGIQFDAVGFTNLSPEHMDFHQTMDHYFQTKTKLFDQLKDQGLAVINTDNTWGIQAADIVGRKKSKPNVISFGMQANGTPTHRQLAIIQNNKEGIALNINDQHYHCPSLFGSYNGYNICMATLLCSALGCSDQEIQKALTIFAGVPGRLQAYTLKNSAKAFVDFAHKPGAFEEVLKTLRPLSTHLIVVFGCGGDRDKTKRPIMGELAATYADMVIITDDNPRTEDRETIAQDILAGIRQEDREKVSVELDRKKAIALAAEKSQGHSIIALLGKGHETYYLINGQKFHLDDLEEIRKY